MPIFRFDGQANLAIYDGQIGALQLGKFSSLTAGYGIKLTMANSFAERVCTDDGGSVLTSGASVRSLESRLLVTAVQTGNVSLYGGEHHLKVKSDCSGVSGYMGGSWGYVEAVSGAKLPITGAIRGMLDLPSGATASGILSMFLGAAGDISGTHTGHVTVLHVPNPTAGTYDNLMELTTASGVVSAHTAGSTSSGRQILISIDGSPYAIPVAAVGT